MEQDFTVERAMEADTVEALQALAQANGVMLSLENAEELFAALHGQKGALSDEALDTISGGSFRSAGPTLICPDCHSKQIRITFGQQGCEYECLNPHCGCKWKPYV